MAALEKKVTGGELSLPSKGRPAIYNLNAGRLFCSAATKKGKGIKRLM